MTFCASDVMCLNPISIPNVNYGQKDIGLNFLKDCTSSRILIRCGHCPECVHASQMGYASRAQMEEKYMYAFMCMFSYNNEMLPYVISSDGKRFKYANFKHLQDMFKRLRKDDAFHGRRFRYFAVSEFGSDEPRFGLRANHRPHFHVLLFLEKKPSDHKVMTPVTLQRELFVTLLRYWAVNRGSKRVPLYAPLCTFRESWRNGVRHRNFDVEYCDPTNFPEGVSGASVYVTKYMIKESSYVGRLQKALKTNYPPEEYDRLWKKVRPRSSRSLGFGLAPEDLSRPCVPRQDIKNQIRRSIDFSISSGSAFPQFFHPHNGKSSPLSRYYRSRFMTADDRLAFLVNRSPDAVDGSFLGDEYDRSKEYRRSADAVRVRKLASSRGDVLDAFDYTPDESFSTVSKKLRYISPLIVIYDSAADFNDNDLPDYDSIYAEQSLIREVISCNNQPSIPQPKIKCEKTKHSPSKT